MSESAETSAVATEASVKKTAESSESAASDSNRDVKVKENDLPATVAVNGALSEEPEEEDTKTKSEAVNGVESKTASTHREVPALLPLQPLQIQIGQSPVPAVSLQTPVVATKSAPPPVPSTPPKTPSPPVSQRKETQGSPAKPTTNKVAKTEEAPMEKKRRSRKRDSFYADIKSEEDDSTGTDDAGRKSKRTRTQTRPFQSTDMDANLLRALKATAAAAAQQKKNEDKLVVFFKGEFLAVRNAEGGFYVCQAMQNIYRGSHKIRIRWLSEDDKAPEKTDQLEIFSPDFYDHTDFECILTNLELDKLGREKYGLPLEERTRAENILKRALDVEKGVTEKPEVTEEHPDGLDVSLLHDESQLKPKKRSNKDEDSSDPSDVDDEPISGTSGTRMDSVTAGSSGSSGRRPLKRTRAAAVAAAARRSAQYYDDDEDDDEQFSDEEDEDADQVDDEDTTSDSEPERPKRRRSSPRVKSTPKPRARSKPNKRKGARRTKKITPPKAKPVIQSKAALKEHPPIVEEQVSRTPRSSTRTSKTPAKAAKPVLKSSPKAKRGRKPVAKKKQEESDVSSDETEEKTLNEKGEDAREEPQESKGTEPAQEKPEEVKKDESKEDVVHEAVDSTEAAKTEEKEEKEKEKEKEEKVGNSSAETKEQKSEAEEIASK